MEIDRKELKLQARERMALTDPKFWVVALTYLALTTGVSWIVALIPLPGGGGIDTIQLFLQLLLNLYTTVVQFGLCLWALWTYRQLDPGVNSLTQGFSVAGRVILMELGIYLRILGWYFIVAVALSIPFVTLLLTTSSGALGILAICLLLLALVSTVIILRLRYALAPYLLADRPDDGPTLPIYRSAALMRGWKMELFKLELSFLGYDIINLLLAAVVTVAALSFSGLLPTADILDPLWRARCLTVVNSVPVVILSTLVTVPINIRLLPYRSVARAAFYDALMVAQVQQRPEMPPL